MRRHCDEWRRIARSSRAGRIEVITYLVAGSLSVVLMSVVKLCVGL